MSADNAMFDQAYDTLRTEFQRLVRERVNQQAKSMAALARSAQFQKSATPHVGRNKIYEETLKNVGNDYINGLKNILFPNCGVISEAQTSTLIKELTTIIDTMRENAKRGAARFAASTGLTKNLESFYAPLDNMYRSAAYRFGEQVTSLIKQSNLTKSHTGMVQLSSADNQVEDEKIQVFFSHSTKDKKRVQDVADFFDDTLFEIFVAHRDIIVSSVWRNEILNHLRKCDVLVSFLTNNFRASEWTDQEVGVAIGRGSVPIVGLQFSRKPYGFIEQYQCVNCRTMAPRDIAQSIMKAILLGFPNSERVRSSFFESLVSSNSFDKSIMFSNLLIEIPVLSEQEIRKTVLGACKNDQIYNSPRTVSNISSILEQNRTRISEQLIIEFENKVSFLKLPKPY